MGLLCHKRAQNPLLSSSDIDETYSISKLSENDFNPISLIGKGSFGNIYLVRFNRNKSLYAMKVLSKSLIRQQNQENNTKSERDLMIKINCPFIVNVKYAFQNETKLFLVQEFVQGGDLFFHLHLFPKFSDEKTKFYVIELVMALDFLHKNNMIYRDLKPENILIGIDGHIKITDFGLSKILLNYDKTYTICGTVQYVAPEILGGEGYNESVDWWSLGCIMFEMLTGRFPFRFSKSGKLSLEVYKKPIKFPDYINDNAKDLISKLLDQDPKKRLGNGINGGDDVKAHPYFNGVNWEEAWDKKLNPPYIPKVKNDLDIKYFEKTYTEEPIYNGKMDSLSNDDEEGEIEENYKGFTYVGSCDELKDIVKDSDPEE